MDVKERETLLRTVSRHDKVAVNGRLRAHRGGGESRLSLGVTVNLSISIFRTATDREIRNRSELVVKV